MIPKIRRLRRDAQLMKQKAMALFQLRRVKAVGRYITISAVRLMLAGALLLSPWSVSHADDFCTAWGDDYIWLPALNRVIPPNLPTDRLIADFGDYAIWDYEYECTGTYVFLDLSLAPIVTGNTINIDGVTYNVQPTNTAGVGTVARVRATLNGVEHPDGEIALGPQGWKFEWPESQKRPLTFRIEVRTALVKTGPIAAGPSDLGLTSYVFQSTHSYSPHAFIQYPAINRSLETVIASCRATTTDVALPVALSSSLANPGATAGATPLTFELQDCPPGVGKFQFMLEPAPGIAAIEPFNGIFGLGSSASAKGIGLRVLDDAGHPISLGQWHTVPGYNPVTGGRVSIPLSASYVGLADSVAAGSVTSRLILTLSYL